MHQGLVGGSSVAVSMVVRKLWILLPFLVLSACGLWRRSSPPNPESPPVAMYPSDLGPQSLDVSAYPPAQRENYRLYAQACSRCHGLARSLNAPAGSRPWWTFYIMGMRVRSRLAGVAIPAEQSRAALEFLDYEDQNRKRGAAFKAEAAELDHKFINLLRERFGSFQSLPPSVVRERP